MYIIQVDITNVKSIERAQLRFENPAGWHVILGDNGSGKSTIAKAIAVGLVCNDIGYLRENWRNWNGVRGSISSIGIERRVFSHDSRSEFKEEVEYYKVVFNPLGTTLRVGLMDRYFSASFGPYRCFTGGNFEKEVIYKTNPRLGAHLSIFGEDVALSEAIPFLINLYIKKLEKKPEGESLEPLVKFINEAKLLPNGEQIVHIDSEGVMVQDAKNQQLSILEMSDGIRSVLSLAFEMIRQMIRVYGHESVFEHIKAGKMYIDLPGVVVIDEIDAHLHPNWQTKIGQWFTTYFPKIQFIVTTHSPLVCRASEKGSIWQLPTPGQEGEIRELTGVERDRLIYGNVLDAYSTGVFGQTNARSEAGQEMLVQMSMLETKAMFGKATETEQKQLETLRKVFVTE